MNNKIESNSIVFAGPFLGEFGWELTHWMPHVRWLREQYKGRKLIVASYPSRHPLYYGIADEFWNLPDWFTKEKYDCDCFEALCDSSMYARLIKHFKDKLDSKYDAKNVVWTKTPRGFNKTLRQNNYVLFDKLNASESAITQCNELTKLHGDKPIVALFARAVSRTKFLDVVYNQARWCEDLRNPLPSNNWPRSHWEDLFDMLYKQFNDQVTFVIGGTKDGNCLLNVVNKYDDVIDLTNIDIKQNLDITVAMLNSALCSISSQSGPTHLSLQCGCPSFIYGHERQRHSVDDNFLGTDVVFLETGLGMYNDSPEVLYKDAAVYIKYLLGQKQEKKKPKFFYSPETYANNLEDWIKNAKSSGIFLEKYSSQWFQNYINRWKTWFNGIKISDNSRILELGFQDGKTLYRFGQKYPNTKLDAIDFNPELSNAALQLKKIIPNLDDIWIGECQNTNKPDGYYDYISSLDFFEHLPEDIYFKTIQECYRLLKDGGYIFVYVGKSGAAAHINERPDEQVVKDMHLGGFEKIRDIQGMLVFRKQKKNIIGECQYKEEEKNIPMPKSIKEDKPIRFGGFDELAKHKRIIKKIGIVGVFDVTGSTNIPFGKAFANAGYHVDTFNYRTVAREIGWDKTNQEIVKFSAAYDLIIFCKCNGVTADTIRMCGRNAITCLYFMDSIDHIKSDPNYYKMAGAADFSVVTTKAVYDVLADGEIKNPDIYHVLQGIDPKEFYPVEDIGKLYDVVFIGQRTAKRDIALMAVKNAGYSAKAYGQGYNNPVYGEDFNIACSESRILLAINNSSPDQDGFSDRIMRYMACKGCVLTEYSKGLNNYFHSEIEWFKTERQMIEEISMLLKNDNLRNSVIENGYKTVLANHTWDKVAEQIIKIATGEEK